MTNLEAQKELKKALKKHFGTESISKIKKEVKSKAVNEYGCYFIEIKIGNGLSICYTSNKNYFFSFYILFQLVGYTETLALTSKDITKSGKLKKFDKRYIFE
jgi:superoxide dismutase